MLWQISLVTCITRRSQLMYAAEISVSRMTVAGRCREFGFSPWKPFNSGSPQNSCCLMSRSQQVVRRSKSSLQKSPASLHHLKMARFMFGEGREYQLEKSVNYSPFASWCCKADSTSSSSVAAYSAGYTLNPCGLHSSKMNRLLGRTCWLHRILTDQV